jgi:hypothetical protein
MKKPVKYLHFNLALHFSSLQPDVHPGKTTLGQSILHITSTAPCSTFVLAASPKFSALQTSIQSAQDMFFPTFPGASNKSVIFLLQQQCTVEVNVTFLQYNGCNLSQPEVVVVQTEDKIF